MFCTALPIIISDSTTGLLTDVILTVQWKLREFLLHRVDPPSLSKKSLDFHDVATFSKSVHSAIAGVLRFAVSMFWVAVLSVL